MKIKLESYPKHVQPFVKWYKRTFWSVGGLNTDDCGLLDPRISYYSHAAKFEFDNDDTQVSFLAWQAGARFQKNIK